MFRKLFFILLVFIIGGLGGALAPFAVYHLPFLSKFQLGGDRPIILNKTEQITITRQVEIDKIIRKNSPALISVLSVVGGALEARGAGFIVSADGLVLTRREWLPSDNSAVSVLFNSQTFPAKIVRRSYENGIVLLKVEASNLPVVSFSSSENKIGSDVFLVGSKQGLAGPVGFINAGILKSKNGDILETNVEESLKLATGTPLLDLNGDVIGINSVDSNGYVFAVSHEAIMKLIYSM